MYAGNLLMYVVLCVINTILVMFPLSVRDRVVFLSRFTGMIMCLRLFIICYLITSIPLKQQHATNPMSQVCT